MPTVDDIPVAAVLLLRKEDNGAFQQYRSHIAALRNQINDEQALRDAAEKLRAEFAALEVRSRITSRKKSLWGAFRDQATIATGTVSVGLGSWLSGLLSPTWSAVVAAAGGVPAAQRLVADALASRRPSPEDAQHPLYFLWKLKKSGKRNL